MLIERRIERHQLPYYLQIFNRYTDKPMGYLGNVSEHGLMLISNLPILVGADFELRLKIPNVEGGTKAVDLNASCLWSHEDETPGNYDSGFMLQTMPVDYMQLVLALQRYFSFHPQSASA